MKKHISVTHSLEDGIVEGRLIDIQHKINELIEEYGEESSITLDSGYNNISIDISFEREETDEEYQERLKKEETANKKKMKQEEREYQEFLRLKEKYG